MPKPEHPPDGTYRGLGVLYLRRPVSSPRGQTKQIYGHIVMRWPQYHVYRTKHQATHVSSSAQMVLLWSEVLAFVPGIDKDIFCGFDAVKYRKTRKETPAQKERRLAEAQIQPHVRQYTIWGPNGKWDCRRI